jgi:PspA-Associated protein
MNHTKSTKRKGIKTSKKTISKDKIQKALKKSKLHNTIREKRSTFKIKRIHSKTRNTNNMSAKKNGRFTKRKDMMSNNKKKVTAKAAKRASSTIAKPVRKSKIVRIMGQGQFTVDNETLKKLNEIDDSIVQLVNQDRSDDAEFKKRLIELTNIVEKNGKPLDSKEIIQSDIILPSADLSIDEAKNLFRGDGVVPAI